MIGQELEDLAELVARKIRQHAVQELPVGVMELLTEGAGPGRQVVVSAAALSYGANLAGLQLRLVLEHGRLLVHLEAYGSGRLASVEFTGGAT